MANLNTKLGKPKNNLKVLLNLDFFLFGSIYTGLM